MRLLDLYCGAGGAAMGYYQAGFTEIIGMDIMPQANYPFTFIQADALDLPFHPDAYGRFDLIHASPPCQAHSSIATGRWGREAARWPDLIAPTRDLLRRVGIPYVIENVSGARRSLVAPVELTGEMFGLTVHRPRLFELGGWSALVPARPPRQENAIAVYGKPDGRRLWDRADGSRLSAWSSVDEGREALQVPWMTDELEIRESIPPAYTRYIGEAFLSQHAASRQGDTP